MNPAKLSTRVTLKAPTISRDAYGGRSITWTTIGTFWANVEPLKGKEILRMTGEGKSNLNSLEISHRVWIRYRRDIKPGWRIEIGNQKLIIQTVINLGYSFEELELLCLQSGILDE